MWKKRPTSTTTNNREITNTTSKEVQPFDDQSPWAKNTTKGVCLNKPLTDSSVKSLLESFGSMLFQSVRGSLRIISSSSSSSSSSSHGRRLLAGGGGATAVALWGVANVEHAASRPITTSTHRTLQHLVQRQLQQQQQQRASLYTTSKPISTGQGRVKPFPSTTFPTSQTLVKKQPSVSFSSSSSNGGFLQWYEGQLSARPVFTKMCTGLCLWSIGDAVAQIVPPMAGQAPPADYDWARTARAAFFGFAIHAPTSHVHFNFLEWLTQRVGLKSDLAIPIFKAFMEQFVYWSWISNSLYHGAMGAMQGMTFNEIYQRIESVLWETQKVRTYLVVVVTVDSAVSPERNSWNRVLALIRMIAQLSLFVNIPFFC